ncbi:RNA 2',3'-cyclic phosphodiesterase [bioreactor metagenome]|uniref:RNA 2',3'-cyclic phosphodiesterase n=1 Tax=bioreactor metagenome TaxID=1076179 RepID=A0A645FB66_9ZZZZ
MNEQATQDEHWRLFIALLVPASIRETLAAVQAGLHKAAPNALIRWTNQEQLHLTLRFMGNVPASSLDELAAALKAAALKCDALRLCTQGIGFFPNSTRPRVVWSGVADDDHRLERVFQVVQEATNPFTVEPQEHRFTGHITLSRVKAIRSAELAELRLTAEKYEGRSFGAWQANELVLMRSVLSDSGARHEVIHSFPFFPGAAQES